MSSAVFYRTNQCNLRCMHCGVGHDLVKRRPHLGIEEVTQVLANLSRSGIRSITLLGGEPFLDPLLFEILSAASDFNINVALNTNLTVSADFDRLVNLSALSSLIVSIDGATAETHDRIRGRGSFERMMRNVKKYNLARHSLNGSSKGLEVSFVLNAMNANNVSEVFKLCERYSVDTLHVTPVQFTGYAKRNEAALSGESALRRSAVEQTILYKFLNNHGINVKIDVTPRIADFMEMKFGVRVPATGAACPGVDTYSYVDMFGNHLPCPAMAFEASQSEYSNRNMNDLNISQKEFVAMESGVFHEFEKLRQQRTYSRSMYPCKSCKYIDQCNPCVADIYRGEKKGAVEICKLFS